MLLAIKMQDQLSFDFVKMVYFKLVVCKTPQNVKKKYKAYLTPHTEIQGYVLSIYCSTFAFSFISV
jgi:hypothetical protein